MSSPGSTAARYAPWSDAFRADPAAELHRLRDEDPVHWCEELGFWVLSSYEDCAELLRDPRLSFVPEGFGANFSMEEVAAATGLGIDELARVWSVLGRAFNWLDAPDHTRIRRLVNQAFSARASRARRPEITAIADELLRPARERAAFDLGETLADPLPAIVISRILGVPDRDRARFVEDLDAVEEMLEPKDGPSDFVGGLPRLHAVIDYTTSLVAERRTAPRSDDLVSGLIAAEEDGDRLDADELVATVMAILGAANTMTKRAVRNGVVCLLRDQEQTDALRSEPALLPRATEEILRYFAPDFITQPPRRVTETIRFRDRTFEIGQQVRLLLGIANRDPSRFPDPDRFDVRRDDAPNLTFGGGPHTCLGASLARSEIQMAVEALLRNSTRLELLDQDQRTGRAFRSVAYDEVQIAWTPRLGSGS